MELRTCAAFALRALALVYVALAGLRTVADTDLGWQMASGRYLLEHHRLPDGAAFAYTAGSGEWIYPPLSGAIFYLLHQAGGFTALSWFSAAAGVGAMALLLRGGGMSTAALVVLAAPLMSSYTTPRAALFTTLLFARLFSLLWRHHLDGHERLWRIPFIMLLWVNLHLGFIAGLAAMAAYVAVELLELPYAARRGQAGRRLRSAAPWLAVGLLATLVNPWGPGIYRAIARQASAMPLHELFVTEWAGMRLSPAALEQAFSPRDPGSAPWWLLAACVVAGAIALRRQRLGVALLLVTAAVLAFRHVRFHGLFAAVAILVGGGEFDLGAPASRRPRVLSSEARPALWFVPSAIAVALLMLVSVRAADLVSNRYYLSAGEISTFGAGPSWWYPERAAAFLERERLPGRVFNDFNLGGYLIWRLPQYPVYIDGRQIPFGPDLFWRYRALMQQSPDAEAGRQEAESRGIQTLIISTARYPGLGALPLKQFCDSQAWRPVYLDDVAAIFVRNQPSNAAWLQQLMIDCATVGFRPPATRDRAELYHFHANAGAVLARLERYAEALNALKQAQQVFSHDPYLFVLQGSVLQALGRHSEAEVCYRQSLRLRRTEQAWFALGHALAAQQRYPEAVAAMEEAARESAMPYEVYRVMGEVRLQMNQPRLALEAFDRAERSNPYQGGAAPLGAGFRALLADGRARARNQLNH